MPLRKGQRHLRARERVYVTRVIIDGVRGFSRARSVDLDLSVEGATNGSWTVLAGRNGSGKTTLLRAIVLALAGPIRSNQLLTELDRWISLGSHRARVEVQIATDSDYDAPHRVRRSSISPIWVGVEWTSPADQHRRDSLAGAPAELKAIPRLGRNSTSNKRLAYATTWDEAPSGYFYAAYGPFRRLTGAGSEAQRLMLAPIPISRVASLFREDASLAESVRWLQEQYFRGLDKRPGASELVDGVIAMLNDGLMPDNIQVDRVDYEGLWLRHARRSLPLQQLSDGYRTVSSLVTDLVRNLAFTFPEFVIDHSGDHPRVMYPGVVLIDEIDVHLHVSWQTRIAPWLRSHFPNMQFIVTTHSPYICQSATERGLIRLPGPSEDGSPKAVDSELYKRIIHGTGDDAVTSRVPAK